MAPRFITRLLKNRRGSHGRPIINVLRELTLIQWGHFWCSWLAWTCDAVDFCSVSLSVTRLTEQFGKETHDITTAITLTLLLRAAGAILFGIISDRFGRKWPLVANLFLIAVIQLGSGFVQTFQQFLGVRALFGIAMGGVWGIASSCALENLPVEARGLASGVLQQGYAVGYLIAAVINLWLVPEVSQSWRALFWTASGLSVFAGVLRMLLPESEVFVRAKQHAKMSGCTTRERTKTFLQESSDMLKKHWVLCIYAVAMMSGFNFLAHGSQDLYPTFLQKSKAIGDHDSTVATIIGNCGAIAGGAVAGFLSQYIGRRLTIILFVLLVGAFIPLWILPDDFRALAVGAFCMQFGVQGALGVIPIHLAEMSPPGFRATFPGVAYQLGNMASSASAQIEATGGDRLKTRIPGVAEPVPDYATVQAMLIGIIAAFNLFIIIIGPENHGAHFEQNGVAFEADNFLAEEEKDADIETHDSKGSTPEIQSVQE